MKKMITFALMSLSIAFFSGCAATSKHATAVRERTVTKAVLVNFSDTVYTFTSPELLKINEILDSSTITENFNRITSPAWSHSLMVQYSDLGTGAFQLYDFFLTDMVANKTVRFKDQDDWLFKKVCEIAGPPSKEYLQPK